mmetsp:Transcript_54136/g.61629  ORF Transcript_54136/g.61629 Transcript_54136/m.61629 type:complete len:86 (+) Transcript_54136:36-293(+)
MVCIIVMDGSTTSSTATTIGGSSMPIPISLIVANIVCAFISVVVVHSFWELLQNDSPVEEALAFYGLYHRYGWIYNIINSNNNWW